MTDCFHPSLATRNFRSISVGIRDFTSAFEFNADERRSKSKTE
jgi:hypothetical protein